MTPEQLAELKWLKKEREFMRKRHEIELVQNKMAIELLQMHCEHKYETYGSWGESEQICSVCGVGG